MIIPMTTSGRPLQGYNHRRATCAASYRHSIILDKTFGETTVAGADDGAGLRHADLSMANSVGTPAAATWSGKSIDRGQTKSKPMIRDVVRTDRTA
jgi:hypothetical protein